MKGPIRDTVYRVTSKLCDRVSPQRGLVALVAADLKGHVEDFDAETHRRSKARDRICASERNGSTVFQRVKVFSIAGTSFSLY